MRQLLQFGQKYIKSVPLLLAVMVLGACTEPPNNTEVREFESDTIKLHREFFDKLALLRNARPNDFGSYDQLLSEVQSKANKFMKELSSCKDQEEVDTLYKNWPTDEYRKRNNKQKDSLAHSIKNSVSSLALKGFASKSRLLKKHRAEINSELQLYVDENGEESYEEEIAEIRLLVREGESRLKSVDRGISGFQNMLLSLEKEIINYHSKLETLISTVKTNYEGWVPPPPAPFHPEKVLFTVETTPALYDSLLLVLLQQYGQFTYHYTASNGDRCVADSKNKEGIVIHLVEPSSFQSAIDSVAQGRADLVFAFRHVYPAVAYAELEEKDANQEGILSTRVAYNALVFKVNQTSALEKIDASELKAGLRGYTIYTGEAGSLDKELCDYFLSSKGVEVQGSKNHLKQGTSDVMSVCAMAYSRENSAHKDVRVARTASVEETYFWPQPGDIVGERYVLATPVNVAFNPASKGNSEAKKFVEYVLSDDGQSVVKSSNFISRNEYEETNPELIRLKTLFEKAGYSIGRVLSYDSFLFPKNDANIIKKPNVTNKKEEFKNFDSTVRSNFIHIRNVLKAAKSDKGIIAVGVIGHASSEGGEYVNRPLSLNRAKYTASCISQDTAGLLILTDGMSSTVPIDDNKTEEGRIRNRRSTAYVLEVFEIGTK